MRTVNVCDWLTGSHGDNTRDGWYQPCCGLKRAFWGKWRPLIFPSQMQGEDVARQTLLLFGGETGGLILGSFGGHCMTGALFFIFIFFFDFFLGVFGAATICAMCYVAWFIFHKLQSSFVVQLYKLCA